MNGNSSEPKNKKKRIEILSEVFKNDPHEKCPVPMPIGSDFMGQCPFLQGDLEVIQINTY